MNQGSSTPPEPVLPYDAEIEYLEGTGTQYIITSYHIASLNYKMESKWAQTEPTTEAKFYVGQNLNNTNYRIGFYSNASNKYAAVYGNRYSASSVSIDTLPHVITYIKNQLHVDGTRVVQTNSSTTYQSNTETVKLFNYTTLEGVPSLPAKLYYFKLWENDILKFDAIPVRVGQIGYMYDRVSGQLFGNAGTGSFILGPDI